MNSRLGPKRVRLVLWALMLAVAQSMAAEGAPSLQCENLEKQDFASDRDAPAQIIEARAVDRSRLLPAYCDLSAYVAPNVTLRLRLPQTGWNGKFLQLGCGGHCGSTDHIRQCADPLRRGYACIVTDGGHQSTAAQALWAYNNWQAQIDYFVRATHVTALAGKAIVERFYGNPPRKSYFMGCSAGGREAMMEAQRFPWDFDGIIAGAPTLNQPAIRVNILWGMRAFNDSSGNPKFNRESIELLHRAVLDRCDLNDGLKDGLIGDPRLCHFDPTTLACKGSSQSACLTADQVSAAQRIYKGPVTSKGLKIQSPGAVYGSERTWPQWLGSGMSKFIQEAFRYYTFDASPGPNWELEEFDFDRDPERVGIATGLYAAVNPDLRPFKAAGGKLLAYVGWNDAGGMPLPVIDYYEAAERVAGGRKSTQEFFRLFTIPGMGHCSGGEGPFTVDWLSALDAWVEEGRPPDELTGFHVQADQGANADGQSFPLDPKNIKFARPLYPYPQVTRYRGRGDPTDPTSFEPADQ